MGPKTCPQCSKCVLTRALNNLSTVQVLLQPPRFLNATYPTNCCVICKLIDNALSSYFRIVNEVACILYSKDQSMTLVRQCGIFHFVFSPRSEAEVNRLKEKLSKSRPLDPEDFKLIEQDLNKQLHSGQSSGHAKSEELDSFAGTENGGKEGGTVVQWLALLPHSARDPGSIPASVTVSVEFAPYPYVCVGSCQ
eukprot:g27803.t1